MPGIFISYRREDTSGYAGRLFDILSDRFGREHTFMDLDTIQGGDDFTSVIEERVARCDVLLAVIGPKWLTITGADAIRRLDAADDFVRLEISKALRRGVRVIPVLVGGASMPSQESLPSDLRPLSLRQSVELRDAYFRADAERLTSQLEPIVGGSARRHGQSGSRRVAFAAAAILVMAGVLGGILLWHSKHPNVGQESHPAPSQPAATALVQQERPAGGITMKPVETPKPRVAAIAGKWKATVTYDWPGAVYEETFNLEVDGTEVSGTASLLGVARGIVTGTIEGERIHFTTKSATELSDKIYQDTHVYKGTVSGDTIHFSMLTESDIESHVPISFEAKRVAVK